MLQTLHIMQPEVRTRKNSAIAVRELTLSPARDLKSLIDVDKPPSLFVRELGNLHVTGENKRSCPVFCSFLNSPDNHRFAKREAGLAVP